jgi:hypothetical protein
MIVTEKVKIHGTDFFHSYSDEGWKIRQIGTGVVYEDALDTIEQSYEETDEKCGD